MDVRIGGAANLTSVLIGSIQLWIQNADVTILFRLSPIKRRTHLRRKLIVQYLRHVHILATTVPYMYSGCRFCGSFDPSLEGCPPTVTVRNSGHGVETPLGTQPAGLAAVSSRTSQYPCSGDRAASCQLRNFDGSYFISRNPDNHWSLEC